VRIRGQDGNPPIGSGGLFDDAHLSKQGYVSGSGRSIFNHVFENSFTTSIMLFPHLDAVQLQTYIPYDLPLSVCFKHVVAPAADEAVWEFPGRSFRDDGVSGVSGTGVSGGVSGTEFPGQIAQPPSEPLFVAVCHYF
jgi:hypothetical protein